MTMTPSLTLSAQEIRKIDHDAFICGLFVPEEKQATYFGLKLLRFARL